MAIAALTILLVGASDVNTSETDTQYAAILREEASAIGSPLENNHLSSQWLRFVNEHPEHPKALEILNHALILQDRYAAQKQARINRVREQMDR